VGVEARARVLAVEGELNAGLLLDRGVDALKARANFLEGQRLAKSEVQVFRKAVVREVASLQGRATFESHGGFQLRLGQCVQEPCEAIVSFEDVLTNAQPATGCETIGEHGDVPLWDHSTAPHGQQFVGRDVELQPPFGDVRTFARQRGIEWNVGGRQTFTERPEVCFCGEGKEFQ